MKKTEAKKQIKDWDKSERKNRSRRLIEIGEMFSENGQTVSGTPFTNRILEETINTYIYGNDMAVLINAICVVEHVLRAKLKEKLKSKKFNESKLESMIDLSAEERIITPEQQKVFQDLRLIRNAYVHQPKKNSFYIISDGELQANAKIALRALFSLIKNS